MFADVCPGRGQRGGGCFLPFEKFLIGFEGLKCTQIWYSYFHRFHYICVVKDSILRYVL